ncbi:MULTISPECIES: arginine--tRNA ligase [Bacillus]|uniref:arginine--tRNA ligase n=1 Tax=Bacillus TaxID=1386 RepID=UPI000BB9B920|nr:MULTISPECIES: arginine--tRNA ligase [Bacillus]
MDYSKLYAKVIHEQVKDTLSLVEIEKLIEHPKYAHLGDLAFPAFILSKTLRKSPVVIAKELADKIKHDVFEKVVAEGPYVNVYLKKELVSIGVLDSVLTEGNTYGSLTFGNSETITIDLSSPNIAKPFSMGHLRSTVIGNALANLAEKCGFKTVRINHLGDWGTQFGKLIVAYQLWGNEQQVRSNPIKELLSLYVKFHEEALGNKQLEDEARSWFKKLEDGNEEALSLWKWFHDESLKEFKKIYKLLNIRFDSFNGEAFYNDKMGETLELLKEKGLLETSDGAEIVSLEEYNLPPCLIKKSDGATLYATRDLTAALYRQKEYGFSKALYVVGHEQSLHFQQVFKTLGKMGFAWSNEMTHIPFGFILKDGKKMSTRKGKVVLLEEVLKEAIDLAKKNIESKNPNLASRNKVAKQVGVGAVIYHDLKNDRLNNIEFSLEEMLTFEGNTGPYVQYSNARAFSILRKAPTTADEKLTGLSDEYSWSVIKLLMKFPLVVEKSFANYDPSQITKYLFELSQEFNKFYSHVKVLEEGPKLSSKLALVKAVTIVLQEGLHLLGMEAPEEM